MPIRYKTGSELNAHLNENDSSKSSSERQSDLNIRRKVENCSSFDKKFTNSKKRFRYGFFIYCIVTNNIKADMEQLDMRGKILIAISRPCSRIVQKNQIDEKEQLSNSKGESVNSKTENTKLNTGPCHFRSKLFVLEFASSSSFTIRNPENQNIEWGQVINFFLF